MAQQHTINGTNVNYITSANWSQPTVDQSLDMIQVHARHRVHTWQSDVMPVATWDTLEATRGRDVAIVTTDPDSPLSDYVTYYGVRVDEVSYREHDSLNVRGVQVRFLVLV